MTQPYPFPVEDVDPDAERAPDPERDDAIAGATVDGTTNSAEADREASYHDDRDDTSRIANGDGTYGDDQVSRDGYADGARRPGVEDTRTATDGDMPDVITADQIDRAAGEA